MKKAFTVPLFFLCIIIYFLFIPQSLGKSVVLKPLWVADIDNISNNGSTSDSTSDDTPECLIRTENYVAALSEGGKLIYHEPIRYDVTIHGDKYINYDSISQMLIVSDDRGRYTEKLETRGYPVFINGRLFIIDTDRGKMKEYLEEKDTYERYYLPSVLTTLDASQNGVLAGFLDGSLTFYSDDGREYEIAVPGDSRYQVVYEAAISDSGNRIAVVSGLSPQYLTMYEYDPVTDIYMDTFMAPRPYSFRGPLELEFFADGHYLGVEDESGIDFFDTGNASPMISVPMKKLLAQDYDTLRDLFLLSGEGMKLVSPNSVFSLKLGGSKNVTQMKILNDKILYVIGNKVYAFTFDVDHLNIEATEGERV